MIDDTKINLHEQSFNMQLKTFSQIMDIQHTRACIHIFGHYKHESVLPLIVKTNLWIKECYMHTNKYLFLQYL